jgi:hypothetical protein
MGVAPGHARHTVKLAATPRTCSGRAMLCLATAAASVALSSDAKTAIIGGPDDNEGVGAAWVFTQ